MVLSGLFKGQFTTAQVGEDEAPQAPRSSAAGASIEAPNASRGLSAIAGFLARHSGSQITGDA